MSLESFDKKCVKNLQKGCWWSDRPRGNPPGHPRKAVTLSLSVYQRSKGKKSSTKSGRILFETYEKKVKNDSVRDRDIGESDIKRTREDQAKLRNERKRKVGAKNDIKIQKCNVFYRYTIGACFCAIVLRVSGRMRGEMTELVLLVGVCTDLRKLCGCMGVKCYADELIDVAVKCKLYRLSRSCGGKYRLETGRINKHYDS